MTHEVIACQPGQELIVAQQLMRAHHKSRILCVDEGGHPVGVISLSDLTRHEDGLRLAKTVREMLNRGPTKTVP